MLGTRLTLIVVILSLAGGAYMAGKHNERASWKVKVKVAEMERAKEVRVIEAQHREKVRKIEIQTTEELNHAEDAVNSLIDQLASAGVREQCSSTPVMPKDNDAARAVNGRARESITLAREDFQEGIGQCRICEITLGQLQEWARTAVKTCNGE